MPAIPSACSSASAAARIAAIKASRRVRSGSVVSGIGSLDTEFRNEAGQPFEADRDARLRYWRAVPKEASKITFWLATRRPFQNQPPNSWDAGP